MEITDLKNEKEQKKLENIRKYILESGFPSEIEVGNILRKKGWIVVNQSPYVDKTTQKIRTIDVSAMKLGLKPPTIGFQLMVECKKSKKYFWAFHTQPKEGEFHTAVLTIIELLKRIGQPPLLNKLQDLAKKYNTKTIFASESNIAKKIINIHTLDKNIKLGIFHLIPPKKNKDDFFEATQQILSAIRSQNSEDMNSFVVFPVIVFDGEIYEFYEEEGELKVLPVNHLQYVSYDEKAHPCMIDVVRKTYFSEFLQIIENDFEIYNEILSNSSGQK